MKTEKASDFLAHSPKPTAQSRRARYNRIISTIILIVFFASLPPALALRQTQQGPSAEAVGKALGETKGAGAAAQATCKKSPFKMSPT